MNCWLLARHLTQKKVHGVFGFTNIFQPTKQMFSSRKMAHWVFWGLVCSPSAEGPMCSLQKNFLLVFLCWELSQPLSVHIALIPTSVCSLLNVDRLLADEHTALISAPAHRQPDISQCRHCLLAFLQLLPDWSQTWGSRILWWLQELSGSLHDCKVPPVTDAADTASPRGALLAWHLLQCLPVLASSRAVMGSPSPSGHKR